jgi:phage terminase large subunit GpA-like protein
MNTTGNEIRQEIAKAIQAGLKTLKRPQPLRLSEWADEFFYLSAESSYIEQRWETKAPQRAIMDCMSNDDIRIVTVRKSARVGYTKMLVASIGYFAEHKRRNQVVFQPVDDDSDDFVKDEIEPMIRDVPVVQRVFPHHGQRSKYNTLSKKVFRGSTVDFRGGKAAKNYRRMSKDVVDYDELDGFDPDIEGEGDPTTLGDKRAEGATFPKSIRGSTPLDAETSLIMASEAEADLRMRWNAPCVHCGEFGPIAWGGPDEDHGLKWVDGDPETTAHMCASCSALMTFEEYVMESMPQGRWIAQNGVWVDGDGYFRSPAGEIVATPKHVAFHFWTALVGMLPWSTIVEKFLKAKQTPGKLKTFVNTMLGEPWREKEEKKVDDSALLLRREPYTAVPNAVVLIGMQVDVQDDRLELEFVGWGVGEESWGLGYDVLRGDPGKPELWARLDDQFGHTFRREDGTVLAVSGSAIDSAGHYTKQVYEWARKHRGRAFAIVGRSGQGRPLVQSGLKPLRRYGIKLHTVGVDTAKELLLFSRLQISEPGPGFCHFPQSYGPAFFKMLVAEKRVLTYTNGRPTHRWVLKKGTRNEALDLRVYGLALLALLNPNLEALAKRLGPSAEKPPAPRPLRVARSNYLSR